MEDRNKFDWNIYQYKKLYILASPESIQKYDIRMTYGLTLSSILNFYNLTSDPVYHHIIINYPMKTKEAKKSKATS